VRRPRIIGVLLLPFCLAPPAAAAADDVPGLRLEHRYTSLDGVTHSVWTQWTHGIEVYDRYLATHVDAAGRLITVTGNPLRELELTTVRPQLSARAARARFGGETQLVAFEGRLAWRVDGQDDLYPDQRTSPRAVNLGADPTWIDRSEGGTKLQGNNAHATTFIDFGDDPPEVAQVGGNWAFPVQFFNQAGCPRSAARSTRRTSTPAWRTASRPRRRRSTSSTTSTTGRSRRRSGSTRRRATTST
jgi:hypothetical protein